MRAQGYSYGDADKLRTAKADGDVVSFSESDIVNEGSLSVHLLPLTDKSGTEQVCFMGGSKPEWVKGGSNVVAVDDDREEVYWGWGAEWSEKCGYKPNTYSGYNGMVCSG